MDAHIDDGDDRLAVGSPRRIIERVLEVGQQRLRCAARGRHHEDRGVVVRLEALVRIGEEQHLAVVGRELGKRFLDAIARQRARIRAADVHHPDFAAEGVAGERCRRAMHRDLGAVARQPVIRHRIIARLQLRFGAGRDDHLPQVPLFVVFVEGVDVVPQPIALAVFRRRRVAGQEIDGRAVRRPVRRRRRRGVTGKCPRLSAIGRDQLELTVANKQQRLAVRRPANAPRNGRVAAFGERELHRRAVQILAPEMRDRTARFPVHFGQHVGERAAVGREAGRA